jgi:hypothetical protein
MNVDRYTKAVLTLIALCLVVIAFRPFVTVGPAHAARKIEYKVGFMGEPGNQWQTQFTNLGNDGWELVAFALDRRSELAWGVFKR